MKLTKGLYGHEFSPTKDAPFGLRCGQMRSQDFVHNGGWYNKYGEKLGWGDLSLEDLQRISQEIDPDELFIVLSESASFWEFVTHNPGPIGAMAETSQDEQNPGPAYVAEHARLFVRVGELFYCANNKPWQDEAEGMNWRPYPRVELAALLSVFQEELKSNG